MNKDTLTTQASTMLSILCTRLAVLDLLYLAMFPSDLDILDYDVMEWQRLLVQPFRPIGLPHNIHFSELQGNLTAAACLNRLLPLNLC